MITKYHAKYFAYELTKRCASNSLEKLSSTLSNAQVDLNPHQIEAALFAFRSPLSRGAILADEVGLGKTIEAGLVLSQRWAERKRRILLIVPSNLRKQWNAELQEKFFLPSIILETKSFNQYIKDGNLNPFNQEEKIVICSYHFARSKSPYIQQTIWDLAVIDEAHRLRNVYKTSNKIAKEIKKSLMETPKLLLTATPLQNSLLELYGLVSIIDDHVFGDLSSFKVNYSRAPREQEIYESELGLVDPKLDMFTDLKERLKPICIRTLRRQVLEYIKFTKRTPLTEDYFPSDQEIDLYNGMSEFLQRPLLFVLPFSQRQLITLILRKLLASSSFAIASTLNRLVYKIDNLMDEAKNQISEKEINLDEIKEDFEEYDEIADEWVDDEEEDEEDVLVKNKRAFSKEDLILMKEEKALLEKYRDMAKKIWKNSKGDALLIALKKGFEMAEGLGANRKAIIFTESRITQDYLLRLLSENGYKDKIVLFNGSNNDDKSKSIYAEWIKKNQDTDKISGSKTADKRAAIVDYFKYDAEILIATEAAAEGINLQFCSLIINYDLPWNPQRIEQRIGRCHRYGQKYDVVVINFVNRKNAADQRIYELLDQKFNLFKGVFGVSDEVLGTIESGVDFEKRIASIYQTCRTEEEINSAFDNLQNEMDESIQSNLQDTRQKLLENFDTEVHEKLKTNIRETKLYLDMYEKWLWDTTRFFLNTDAEFSDHEYSFKLINNPFPENQIHPGPYRIGKNIEDAHIYRPGHPLAQNILKEVKGNETGSVEIEFDCSNHPTIISVLKPLVGKKGFMKVSNYSIEALEGEDHLVMSLFDDAGEPVHEEIAKKIFLLNGKVLLEEIVLSEQELQKVDRCEQETINVINSLSAERNSEFFDDEVDKLDKWSEDMKKTLEIDLKRLDIDIKTAKTNAKKIIDLKEKVKAQRQIKDMEKKRNEMRRRLYEAQDDVDDKKEKLIERVEDQLKQKTSLKELFKIRWRIV
ncbi:MAG: DEAD/DEAH box helicase family protein [Candidatus Omnitrophica bacterium]|nr:DEAD/DEAH box helicase family protein [Candidatus Omnitrophota bacterium]